MYRNLKFSTFIFTDPFSYMHTCTQLNMYTREVQYIHIHWSMQTHLLRVSLSWAMVDRRLWWSMDCSLSRDNSTSSSRERSLRSEIALNYMYIYLNTCFNGLKYVVGSDPLPYTINQLVMVSSSNVRWTLVGWTYLVSCSFSCRRCFRWLCRSSLSCLRSTNTAWFECSNWACSVDTFTNSASMHC